MKWIEVTNFDDTEPMYITENGYDRHTWAAACFLDPEAERAPFRWPTDPPPHVLTHPRRQPKEHHPWR